MLLNLVSIPVGKRVLAVLPRYAEVAKTIAIGCEFEERDHTMNPRARHIRRSPFPSVGKHCRVYFGMAAAESSLPGHYVIERYDTKTLDSMVCARRMRCGEISDIRLLNSVAFLYVANRLGKDFTGNGWYVQSYGVIDLGFQLLPKELVLQVVSATVTNVTKFKSSSVNACDFYGIMFPGSKTHLRIPS